MLSCSSDPETRAPTLRQHNHAHPIVHPPSSSTGEHRNHLDAGPGLEPQITIQHQRIRET